MIQNYSNFVLIKEGSGRNNILYYNKQIEELLKDEWYNFSVQKAKVTGKLELAFESGDSKYNNYSIIFEKKYGTEDFYYLENPETFIQKFKNEFSKHASENINKFREKKYYIPKCLNEIVSSAKYNI